MRRLLLLVLLLAPATLRAQPAPDAPVAQHVAHLLELARDGFRSVRGPVTYGPGTTMITSVLESRYAMRFQGAEVASEIRVNANYNVLHVSRLPVADRARLPEVWAAVADSIGRVVPAGWQEMRLPGPIPFVGWNECGSRGRQIALDTTLPSQAPGLNLIVWQFDAACPQRQ